MTTTTLGEAVGTQPDFLRSEGSASQDDDIVDGAVLPRPSIPPEKAELADNGPEGSTVEGREKEPDISRLIRLSSGQGQPRGFRILQQWEGVVTEISGDAFWAEILDLTDRTRAMEVVEIPLSEIPDADMKILEPGTVFYWCIGYEDKPGGSRRRVSEIRVRRSPVWSKHAINSMNTRAQELFNRFNNGNGENDSAQDQ